MPRKKRELRKDLLKAGFKEFPGKGSHRVFKLGALAWVLSGQLGDDADHYQEKAVKRLIEQAKNRGRVNNPPLTLKSNKKQHII